MSSPDLDLLSASLGVLLDDLTTVVSKAAATVMAIDATTVAVRAKADQSPVTLADEAAQEVIVDGLTRLFPGVPIISEEANDALPVIDAQATFILVDPIDGTREFLSGSGEFTINIAIMSRGVPAVGCIGAPALGLIWRGIAGRDAERLELSPGADARACRSRTAIRTRPMPEGDVAVAVSRSHFDAHTGRFLAHFPNARRMQCGSSLKFCRVAEGSIDLYPRLAPMHEWDIAAGHAIVEAAGGAVVRPGGGELAYGEAASNFLVPAFLALGDRAAAERIAALAA